jgi:methionine-rich copper-binding protein CopC
MSRRHRLMARVSLATGLLLGLAQIPALPLQVAAAGPCDVPITNPVACENSKPGDSPLDWDIASGGDPSIEGFTTDISVNLGDTVHFKINTDAADYTIDIFRMGYYGGLGARHQASVVPTAPLPQFQPPCLGDKTVGLVDCGNWQESASWTVPPDAVSGIYFALLHRTDTGGENHVVFIVRNDASHSAILFKTSDTTWQAYNQFGGNSFYGGESTGSESASGANRAFKLSYNRPFETRLCCSRDWVFSNEYPMVRFLEANGYDVSYFTGVDTARFPSLITQHQVLMSTGHDEYWSGQERANVEAARNAGVNLAFFSGNEVFWKTRWENSIDASTTPYRTLVSYKETWSNAKIDPSALWTGTWRDPRFSPPADGGRPENALTGTIYTVNCCTDAIQVPSDFAGMRLWRDTAVAALQPGQVATLGANTLGYEWDEDLDNGARPPGLIDLSSTTLAVPQKLLDYGSTTGPGTATHKLTLYRAPGGALVFGAGTVQWAWGLDSNHDGTASPANPTMQQATVNLLADMGAQASTLLPGLTPEAASTDTIAPTTTITSPAAGTNVTAGTPLVISGTATDSGGGVVAGVEVSTDGGATWHPASGRANWSFTWIANVAGAITIKARAIDDSANIDPTPPTVAITVSCPCSIWNDASVPSLASASDPGSIEVGVKFRTDTDAGAITGIRFYKGAGNTGTHIGNLWTANGTLLASATFTTETASGWQEADFASPVAVTSNTTYIASYFAPNGGYAADANYFVGSGVDSSPLHALKNGIDGPNGVFRYGATSTFPNNTFGATNYWVDVVFNSGPDVTPPGVMATTPASDATAVSTTSAISATFTEEVNPSSVVLTLRDALGNPVAGTVSYDSPSHTASLQPSAAMTSGSSYTASVSAADVAGNAMAGPASWSFSTAGPRTCPCTIWPFSASPATASSTDTTSVEVGVKFRPDISGFVTGIRFYKGAGNSGTHVGNLWAADGTQIGSATFTNETASGWQQVTFASAVPVTAGTTYVASYFAPNGHYAADAQYFATHGVDTPPLHALATGVDGANGVYHYGVTGGFPSSSINAANYWVDVIFDTQGTVDTTPPTVSLVSPTSGASGVPVTASVTASFSEPVRQGSIVFALHDPSGRPVGGSLTYDPATHVASLQPTTSLAFSTSFTASVQATDLAGNAMASSTVWSFTTADPSCPCHIFDGMAPTVQDSGDAASAELGIKFRSDMAGFATGIRFYKATTNTGTHIGNLWSANGTLLASATFSAESASGWQQVNFSSAVPVTAGTTYIASYFAPSGHYAVTTGAFLISGADAAPLHALANGVDGANGVFHYGTDIGFPTNSSNASNYWVDVVFDTQGTVDTTPPSVSATTPAAGATGVPSTTAITAAFSEAIRVSSLSLQLRDSAGALVNGSVTYDSASHAATFQPSPALSFSTTYTASTAATDLAGNAMASPATWSFTTGPPTCPCSILGTAFPSVADSGDLFAVELGVKFRVDVSGFITGIRFYKSVANSGTHVGNLWASDGSLLASATFSTESAAGWQQVTFGSAVAVTPGTTYVASYFAPAGHYAVTSAELATQGIDAPPLHALASGVDGANGVYRYGNSSAFPTSSYNASDYWVDVTFDTHGTVDTTPPTVIAQSPAAGATGVPTSSGVAATFSEAVQASSVAVALRDSANNLVAGTVSYDTTTHVASLQTGTHLTVSTTYTASAQATDLAGNAMAAPSTWSFTTGTSVCPCSVWSQATTPALAAANDPSSVELGVKFRSDQSGFVTGIRFYKGPGNTGTHLGNLWSVNGTLLASATFVNESAAGWQQVSFGSAVPVTAGTTYVASYFAPGGHYAADDEYFVTSVDASPLHALASGIDGPNGVYRYGNSGFPTNSFDASNYWVDLVFDTHGTVDTTPPTVTAENPVSGATGASPNGTVSATFSEPVQAGSVSLQLRDGSNTLVGGSLSYDATTHAATLQPSAVLALSTTYTASAQATDLAGNAMAVPFTWSFTTAAPSCPCTIFGSATPSVAESGDPAAVELGVKFRTDVGGFVTGIRFYKGAGNTGTHVGSLWRADGTLLASASFSNESASGWQQVNFGSAVAVTAGTTYIASYFAPNGDYAADAGYFASTGKDSGALHALASGVDGPNAVFHYGAGGGFPANSFNATNYWVDVVFDTQGAADTTPPTVTAQTPAAGATGIAVGSSPTATFSEPVQSASINFQLRDAANAAVPATVTYDAASRTASLRPASSLAFSTTYTASVIATDLAGNAMPAPLTWSFTTAAPQCPCSLFSGTAVPGTADSGDTAAVELGVKLRVDVPGFISGIRFYKSSGNTGIHIGNLWTATGTLLASGNFSNETASGWQQLNFASAVAVTAGTTYVVSYFSPAGHYAVDANVLAAQGIDAAPLHALANGVDGGNGVYRYGGVSGFPTSSFNASNYWLDVVFDTQGTADTTPPTVTAVTPSGGATGVPVTIGPTATFSEPVQSGSVVLQLRDAANALVPGGLSYDAASRTATLQPGATLAFSASYTASASATDLAGNAMASPFTWSFTTAAPNCPCSLFADTTVPAIADSGDPASVELGVKFRTDVSGQISGIRFYKSAANTGVHIGNLWAANGTLLATANFSNETASGWQQVTFASPVAVTANTTYVASYFAPAGHYAVTDEAFVSAGVDAAPLHILASATAEPNGVYRYGVDSGFPSSSFNASNYWVDVIFTLP